MKSSQAGGATVQLGLEGEQVPCTVPKFGVFAMATKVGGGGPPQNCSLECTNPTCTLGDNGAKYKTPEYPLEYAMQLLVMHNENHKQPVTTGEASTKKCRAEKVCRPTIKMGSSENDFIFFQCFFESYKRSCQLTDVADIRDQLLACCEIDLRRDLHWDGRQV